MCSKRIFYPLVIVLLGVFLTMCSSPEKTAQRKSEAGPCTRLTAGVPSHTLAFVARETSKREDIASQRAKKATVIQLTQFFQSQFIEGEQLNLFESTERLGNWDEEIQSNNREFQKKWAETSLEMIATMHNRDTFNHTQQLSQDSSGTVTAYNLLTVTEDWIRNHWKKSLEKTNAAFYTKVNNSKYRDEIKNISIEKDNPCRLLN